MTNKNYRSGAGYEYRFVQARLKNSACVSKRFYASRGITDVYWVSESGTYSEAQLKFSKTKPRISKAELKILKAYAKRMPFSVYLVMKASNKKEIWELLN